MSKTIYVCTGGCGGRVTEHEFQAGKMTCGDPNCPKHRLPFEERLVCDECGATYRKGEEHAHVK